MRTSFGSPQITTRNELLKQNLDDKCVTREPTYIIYFFSYRVIIFIDAVQNNIKDIQGDHVTKVQYDNYYS